MKLPKVLQSNLKVHTLVGVVELLNFLKSNQKVHTLLDMFYCRDENA